MIWTREFLTYWTGLWSCRNCVSGSPISDKLPQAPPPPPPTHPTVYATIVYAYPWPGPPLPTQNMQTCPHPPPTHLCSPSQNNEQNHLPIQ